MNLSEAQVSVWTLDLYFGLTLAQSRSLLDSFFEATRRCLGKCGPYRFKAAKEQLVDGGSSKVDYDA